MRANSSTVSLLSRARAHTHTHIFHSQPPTGLGAGTLPEGLLWIGTDGPLWLGWKQERPDNWRLGGGPARAAFADVAAAIARFEPVRVCVPRAQAWSAEALLPSKHANVSTVEMEMDDAWLRDTGPTVRSPSE